MADWDTPALSDAYALFMAYLKARDVDCATMDFSAASNIETGTIQYVAASDKFQVWDGGAWVDLVLSAAGGGTGDVAALGTMAYQAAAAVAITGGTASGITALTMSGHILFALDGSYNLGTPTARIGTAHIKEGLMIPCGSNKWVP